MHHVTGLLNLEIMTYYDLNWTWYMVCERGGEGNL